VLNANHITQAQMPNINGKMRIFLTFILTHFLAKSHRQNAQNSKKEGEKPKKYALLQKNFNF
jgi:hypothetical protein